MSRRDADTGIHEQGIACARLLALVLLRALEGEHRGSTVEIRHRGAHDRAGPARAHRARRLGETGDAVPCVLAHGGEEPPDRAWRPAAPARGSVLTLIRNLTFFVLNSAAKRGVNTVLTPGP